jgi:hypothetical protein
MTRGHISGFYELQVYTVDDNGFPMGTLTTPNAPASGTTTHAYRTKGPIEASAPSASYRRATFTYGMKNRGSRDLGVSDFGEFDITLSSRDSAFDTLIGGGATDTTNAGTNHTLWAPNTNKPSRPRLGLILTQGFQGVDDEDNEFIHYFYPNVQIRAASHGANSNDGENPNPLQFTVIPSAATRTPFGLSVEDTAMGLEDDSDIVFYYKTEDRIALTTYIAANAATTFVLGYRPLYSEVAGAYNVFTMEGNPNTADVTALNTTTGAATIASATVTDIYVAVYPTEFLSI